MLSLVNAERSDRGLPALSASGQLGRLARAHSKRMHDQQHLHHQQLPPAGLDVRDGDWVRVTENVGYGGSVEQLHRAFMDSDGHRRNILDAKVTDLGVGFYFSGSTLWVTKLFIATTAGARLPVFADVDRHTHERSVSALWLWGVSSGAGDGSRFFPARTLSRAEAASVLARAAGVATPAVADSGFDDVPAASVHAPAIAALAEAGVVAGCGGRRFCPDALVSRAQLASVLARLLDLPREGSSTRFVDVADSSPHAAAIAAVDRAGITRGCAPERFCPAAATSRGQVASLVARAFGLAASLDGS